MLRRKISSLGMLIVLTIVLLSGCGGNLRYSQSAPEAKDFHPARIGVLHVNTEAYPAASGISDTVITDALVRKGWFQAVVQPDVMKGRLEKNQDSKKIVNDYIQKLKMVNFSDPDLSRKIGEIYTIQAFMIARVTLWNYSEEGGKNWAKVGLAMKLVDAGTGTVMWRANHNRITDYWLIKPKLSDMAGSLAREMLGHMPR